MKKTLLFRALLCALACLLVLSAAAEPAVKLVDPTQHPIGALYRKHSSKYREDYPHLTEEAFANFRCVTTTGMGRKVLYRSSSPINPTLNRDYYADTAARNAGIRTVLNLADSRKEMEAYEWYESTYYSGLDVLPLHMSQDRTGKSTRKKLAKGFRYIIGHDGPYLIHCTKGRDRTGFTCAILECLMGASSREVIDDHMLTYFNFYGIEPGMELYDSYRDDICADLAKVFRVDSITAEGVDLAQCAHDYILRLGLTEDEISALKARLGTDLP